MYNIDTLGRVRIKAEVRARMRGIWGWLFVACLLPSLTIVITGARGSSILFQNESGSVDTITGVHLLSLAVNILLIAPMRVSLSQVLLHTLETSEKPRVLGVFSCFDSGYFRIVRAMLPMQLRLEGWGLLLLIVQLTIPGSLGAILSVAVFAWSLNRSIAYLFTPYIVAENPRISGGEAVARSINTTRGRRLELFFALDISFIGWALLTAVTFGLAIIYTLPYQMLTECAYYTTLRGEPTITGEVR
ncbi:MAG: DUF975 family protein [Oscillospiraceae bacterium]|jgi:hypothetical protein|nr:DUF975 family protein [Oscillospiraceae bacterium]